MNYQSDYRRDGKTFRLWKSEEDITCPKCLIGKLIEGKKTEWNCSVCNRYFDEVVE